MLNPSNTKTAAIITIVGLLYIVSFLFSTEVFTDNSVISQSPVLTWCLLLAIIPSVVFCMLNLKLSLFISFISLGSLAALSALLIMYKNTLGFYVIENDVARKLIDNTNLKEFEDVTKISGGWIRNQTVTVLFYGKKEVNYDSSEKALIKADELKKVQDKFIKKVFEESAKRKDLGKPLIVSEDFKLLEIKNKGNNKLVLKMLDSIHYTKFPKNVIIMFNVNDHKNLKSNGFSRSVIEKFKNTGSKSKGSGKSDPPKSKDGPEGVSSGQQPSTPESENKDESGLDDSTRERAGNEDVTRADSKSRSEAPVNGRDTSNLPASEKKSTDEQPEEVISEGQQNINSDANLRTESADEGSVVEDSENVQSVADENHAVHSESVIADANAFTEPVSESPVVNEPENVQPVLGENEAVHSGSVIDDANLPTERTNESPVVNEPENIQPVVVENEAVHSESVIADANLPTEHTNESPVVEGPESTNDSNQKSSPEAEELEDIQAVLGENEAVHSESVIDDANAFTEPVSESPVVNEPENVQPVLGENQAVHSDPVIADANAFTERTNESPDDSNQKSSPEAEELEDIQAVLGENQAVHSESVIADANAFTEPVNESPVINKPENVQPVVVENQAVHSDPVIADANAFTEPVNESPVVNEPESKDDSNQKSSPEVEELENNPSSAPDSQSGSLRNVVSSAAQDIAVKWNVNDETPQTDRTESVGSTSGVNNGNGDFVEDEDTTGGNVPVTVNASNEPKSPKSSEKKE